MPDSKSKSNEDLRIRRTIKLLTDALFSLLEEKTFDEISVNEICERAMIHRTTFYKHFEDKYHLVNFCIKNLQDSFSEECISEYTSTNPKAYYLSLIKMILHYFSEHKKMILLLTSRGNCGTALIMLHNIILKDIEQRLKDDEKRGVKYLLPVTILAEYHVGALISLCLWWIKNSMPYSEEDMIQYIDLLLSEKFLSFDTPID